MAIVPIDVKAPVVALIVYMSTLPADRGVFPIRHISELAGWIHDHRRGKAQSRTISVYRIPVDVKAPVVASMVYIATLPSASLE